MSKWVEHIKDYAKRNNLTYGCALSDPKCSEEYRVKYPKPVKTVKGKKGKKLDLSKTEFVPLEEAEIDTEPKTKMIVAKKPPAPEPINIIKKPAFYLKLPFTEDYYLNPKKLVEENKGYGKPYITNTLYFTVAEGISRKDYDTNQAQIVVKKLRKKYPEEDLENSLIGLAKELQSVYSKIPNTIRQATFKKDYGIKIETLEEAEIDTEPKTKMIVEKKPPAPKTKPVAPKAVRDWVFKADKKATPVERAYLLNALPNDRKIAEEGLYKNNQAEDFNVGDFKDAIDKKKKPETSVLLRIAKYLQREGYGKIVYSKGVVTAPEAPAKGKGITTKNISKNITCGMPLSHSMILKMVGDGLSKMYGGSLSGSESEEELTNIFKNFTMRGEADNEPMGMSSARQGVSLIKAIAKKPPAPKITGAKRNKSPEAVGESSSGKKQEINK